MANRWSWSTPVLFGIGFDVLIQLAIIVSQIFELLTRDKRGKFLPNENWQEDNKEGKRYDSYKASLK